MPLFEYTCKKCATRFEHLARSGETAAPKCPKCGHPKTERELSRFSASVRGGGDSCVGGSCGTSSCPTGTCPFA
jgi:putative FmdB family regulatory protein